FLALNRGGIYGFLRHSSCNLLLEPAIPPLVLFRHTVPGDAQPCYTSGIDACGNGPEARIGPRRVRQGRPLAPRLSPWKTVVYQPSACSRTSTSAPPIALSRPTWSR